MRRICKYCGREYEGDPGGSCCPDCAAEQRKTTIRERVCRQCGRTFPGGPRAWYCPDCRRERKAESDRRHRQRGTARPLGSIDRCVICGGEYIVSSARQRYCPDCAAAAVRAVDREQSRAWTAEHTTPEERREVRKAAGAAIPCAVCGKMFVPTSSAVTCSAACAEELHRRRSKEWEAGHRDERNAERRQRRQQKESEMSPEELREHREAVNARARENYKKRKNSKSREG